MTVLPDGSVAVSDTYNGAVRRYDPATDQVSTLLTGLAEPSDAVVLDGDLLVVESAAHRLTRVRLPDEALVVDGVAQRTHRPVTEVAPGAIDLEVVFTPPPGQKLDERYGPATRLVVSATPPALLREGEGRGEGLSRPPGARPARRRRRPARGRDGGVLRRRGGGRGVPRLPRAPAGLGGAGAARRRRPGAARALPRRLSMELIASGRDSDVFAYADGLVLRRYRDGRSAEGEAATLRAVADLGYPVPAPADGRRSGDSGIVWRGRPGERGQPVQLLVATVSTSR